MLAEHAIPDFNGAVISPSVPSRSHNALGCSRKSLLTHIVVNFHFPATSILTVSLSFDSFLVGILSVSHVVQRNH